MQSLLEKKDDENNFNYHKRLVYGKLIDHTLADYDYSELSEYAYGKKYSSDVARRMFYGSKHTLQLIDENNLSSIKDNQVLSDIDQKIIELRKERQKFYDQRNAFNKTIRDRARQEELNEILIKAVKSGNLPKLKWCPPVHIDKSSNDLLVSLNDIHFGINIENAWTQYNSEICEKMFENYLGRIISIAETHHSENCIVYNCGDSISGKIHQTIQLKNKENIIEQVKGVSELIAEFLSELSKYFANVRYVSVSGNHSRLDTRENSLNEERLDDLIEWYLKARLQDFRNIHIATSGRIDPTMFVIQVRGKTYCGVHGDLEVNATRIATLQTMVKKPLYAILCGHKHHNSCDELNGVKIIMAGSFLGTDDHCIQKRIIGKPEQMVSVCDESGIVCHYDIPLENC